MEDARRPPAKIDRERLCLLHERQRAPHFWNRNGKPARQNLDWNSRRFDRFGKQPPRLRTPPPLVSNHAWPTRARLATGAVRFHPRQDCQRKTAHPSSVHGSGHSLSFEQAGEAAIPGDHLRPGARLDHPSVLDQKYPVTEANCRKPVGNHDHGQFTAECTNGV